MDHKFSLHLHGRPRLIKIVDQIWVNEKLVQDGIMSYMSNLFYNYLDIQVPEDKSFDLKNTKGIPLNTNDTLNDDEEVEEAFHNTETSWNETQSFDL
jgi:hypothetical protein